MKTSEKCKHMMMHHEGVRFKPYLCPAKLWTIGVGHVMYPDQATIPIIRKDGYTGMIRHEYPLSSEHNRQWSKEEVMAIFSQDLSRFERGVLRFVPGCAGHQGRFDALVSFAFNVGLGTLQKSTLRQKCLREDWEGAAEEFLKYTKGGGKVLPGLVKRRNDERALFMSGSQNGEQITDA
jgi:lysozyme